LGSHDNLGAFVGLVVLDAVDKGMKLTIDRVRTTLTPSIFTAVRGDVAGPLSSSGPPSGAGPDTARNPPGAESTTMAMAAKPRMTRRHFTIDLVHI